MKFYELSEDGVKAFNDVFKKKTFPIGVKFQFVGCEQKCLIKIKKISPDYAFVLEKELMVCINEELLEAFDKDSVKILIEQEIDKITINMESGAIKLIKTDLNTFSSLISKYGVEKVSKANQITELYNQQVKDGQEELISK